jgi:hypothetical protein
MESLSSGKSLLLPKQYLIVALPLSTVLGFSAAVVTGITMVFVVTYMVGFSPTLVIVAKTVVELVPVLTEVKLYRTGGA